MKQSDNSPLVYSSKLLNVYVDFLKRYEDLEVLELLIQAEIPIDSVDDGSLWISYTKFQQFYASVSKKLEIHDLAYQVGLYSFSTESFDSLEQFALTFLDPKQLFIEVQKVTETLLRTVNIEAKTIEKGYAEFAIRHNRGFSITDIEIGYLRGLCQATILISERQILELKILNGLNELEKLSTLRLKWGPPKKSAETIAQVACSGLLALVWSIYVISYASEFLADMLRWYTESTNLLVIVSVVLSSTLLILEKIDKKNLRIRVEKMRELSVHVFEKSTEEAETNSIVRDIQHELQFSTSVHAAVTSASIALQVHLDYDFGFVALYDEKKDRLTHRSSYGLTAKTLDTLRKSELLTYRGEKEASKLWLSFARQTTATIRELANTSNDILAAFNSQSIVCVPIISETGPIGELIVGYAAGAKKQSFEKKQVHVLEGLSSILGTLIQHAEFLETQNSQSSEIVNLEDSSRKIAAERDIATRLAEELQVMNEEVKSFTYIVSHDLRAPLVNIKGFGLELQNALVDLTDELKDLGELKNFDLTKTMKLILEEDIPEALSFINMSIERMDQQINAILQLSRAGRKDLAVTEINSSEVIKTILKSLGHQIQKSQTRVRLKGLPVLQADKTSLEQIFGNIIDNALKYLDPSRNGELSIVAKKTATDYIFEIADNGLGIDPKNIHKVFQIFRRAGNEDTAKGDGFGMAYVRALVRRNGGRIWCDSELNVGTTFTVTFPLEIKKVVESD